MATVSEQNRNRDCVFGFGRHWIWTVADRVIANFGLVALGLGDHAVSRWKVHAWQTAHPGQHAAADLRDLRSHLPPSADRVKGFSLMRHTPSWSLGSGRVYRNCSYLFNFLAAVADGRVYRQADGHLECRRKWKLLWDAVCLSLGIRYSAIDQ